MKTLYLVRHAKSSWDNPSLADHDRPLNGRGKRDAPFMASLLADKGVRPDALVSSTAKRARLTAGHFARAFGGEESELLLRPEIYESSARTLQSVIEGLDDNWNTVLLFGHNPGFNSLAWQYDEEFSDNIPTCGIVRLMADVDHWRDFRPGKAALRDFIYPKMFNR